MHIAILTFDGFNELDSLIALGILNRVKQPNWRVSLASPTRQVRSMNGVHIEAQASVRGLFSTRIERVSDDLSDLSFPASAPDWYFQQPASPVEP